uniref:Peptidase C1A papain C-terminal domain-containing protein n=1 Tax=Triticum urartu TaxID=4572 RepID=A0A8R7REH6_TRIUA
MVAKVVGQRMYLTSSRNGGVVSENDYPYCAIRGPCKAVEAAGVTIANWAAVEPTEEAVKYAVAYQPVVASIYTDSKFMTYKRDFLIVPKNHGPVDHSVLLIGYGKCP